MVVYLGTKLTAGLAFDILPLRPLFNYSCFSVARWRLKCWQWHYFWSWRWHKRPLHLVVPPLGAPVQVLLRLGGGDICD